MPLLDQFILPENVALVRELFAIRNGKAVVQVVDHGMVGWLRVFSVAPSKFYRGKPVPIADYEAWRKGGSKADADGVERMVSDATADNASVVRKQVLRSLDALVSLGAPRQRDVLIIRPFEARDANPITGGGSGGWAYRKHHAMELDASLLLSGDFPYLLVHEWAHKFFFNLPKHVVQAVKDYYRGSVLGKVSDLAPALLTSANVEAAGRWLYPFWADLMDARCPKPKFRDWLSKLRAKPLAERLARYKADADSIAMPLLLRKAVADAWGETAEKLAQGVYDVTGMPYQPKTLLRGIPQTFVLRLAKTLALSDADPNGVFALVLNTMIDPDAQIAPASAKPVNYAAGYIAKPEGGNIRAAAVQRGLVPTAYGAADHDELFAEAVATLAFRPAQVSKPLAALIRRALSGQVESIDTVSMREPADEGLSPSLRSKLDPIVRRIRELFPEATGIELVGSAARGELDKSGKRSDIDIVIRVPQRPDLSDPRLDTLFSEYPRIEGRAADFITTWPGGNYVGQQRARWEAGKPTPTVLLWGKAYDEGPDRDRYLAKLKELGLGEAAVPPRLYHGTSREGAQSIQREGIRMDKSNKGYFGRAFYVATERSLAVSNYADFAGEEPGAVVTVSLTRLDRVLDLRDEAAWARWSDSGLANRVGADAFDRMAVAAGIDGVYDNSVGGYAIYNPKIVKVVNIEYLGAKGTAKSALEAKEPVVMDFEQWAATRGASALDFGDAGLHRGYNKQSRAARERNIRAQVDKDVALERKRDELRAEYDAKVAAGEIRPPTRVERLRKTAAGHPDNPSVQAARRLLLAAGEKGPWEAVTSRGIVSRPQFSTTGAPRGHMAAIRRKRWRRIAEGLHPSERSRLFVLGREINLALPPPTTLRPTDQQMTVAAKKMGVTRAEAWRAWQLFTWGNEPSEGVVSESSFDRRLAELRAAASKWGWAVSGDEQVLSLRNRLGRVLTARRGAGGDYTIEVAQAETYSPRGVNALNLEITKAVRFVNPRVLVWDGARSFHGADVFRVLRDYVEANPVDAVEGSLSGGTKGEPHIKGEFGVWKHDEYNRLWSAFASVTPGGPDGGYGLSVSIGDYAHQNGKYLLTARLGDKFHLAATMSFWVSSVAGGKRLVEKLRAMPVALLMQVLTGAEGLQESGGANQAAYSGLPVNAGSVSEGGDVPGYPQTPKTAPIATGGGITDPVQRDDTVSTGGSSVGSSVGSSAADVLRPFPTTDGSGYIPPMLVDEASSRLKVARRDGREARQAFQRDEGCWVTWVDGERFGADVEPKDADANWDKALRVIGTDPRTGGPLRGVSTTLVSQFLRMEGVAPKHPDEPKMGRSLPDSGELEGETRASLHTDAMVQFRFAPARYAKGMIAFQADNDSDWKNRPLRLADAVSGARYSGRERAYLMSRSAANRLLRLLDAGWTGSPITGVVEPPERLAEKEEEVPPEARITQDDVQQYYDLLLVRGGISQRAMEMKTKNRFGLSHLEVNPAGKVWSKDLADASASDDKE